MKDLQGPRGLKGDIGERGQTGKDEKCNCAGKEAVDSGDGYNIDDADDIGTRIISFGTENADADHHVESLGDDSQIDGKTGSVIVKAEAAAAVAQGEEVQGGGGAGARAGVQGGEGVAGAQQEEPTVEQEARAGVTMISGLVELKQKRIELEQQVDRADNEYSEQQAKVTQAKVTQATEETVASEEQKLRSLYSEREAKNRELRALISRIRQKEAEQNDIQALEAARRSQPPPLPQIRIGGAG